MLPCVTGWQRRKPPILEPPESIPLVDLAAAAAACLVGIGRAGYAVGCRRGAGRDLVFRQRPAGAAVPGLLHTPDAALLVARYRPLCTQRSTVYIRPQKHPPGEEHGSARWGDVFALNRKYADKAGPNLLLTRHFRIGVDGYKHKHNTNILVVGGSGAGKTRTYAVPNVLEAAKAGPGGKGCSLVLTDPKVKFCARPAGICYSRATRCVCLTSSTPVRPSATTRLFM